MGTYIIEQVITDQYEANTRDRMIIRGYEVKLKGDFFLPVYIKVPKEVYDESKFSIGKTIIL